MLTYVYLYSLCGCSCLLFIEICLVIHTRNGHKFDNIPWWAPIIIFLGWPVWIVIWTVGFIQGIVQHKSKD